MLEKNKTEKESYSVADTFPSKLNKKKEEGVSGSNVSGAASTVILINVILLFV